MDIIDFIGYNGPIITFIIGFVYLLKRPPYLIVYLVFTFINQFIIRLLKGLIREPRPILHNKIDEEKYGMPSGHAEHIFYFITFTYLVNESIIILLLELFISFLTLYQRWKSKNHTIKQLIVGSLLGCIIAYFSVILTRIYLKNK
jgi:membrane-associated phospholipid phosphatase